jgi:hypothetical protein
MYSRVFSLAFPLGHDRRWSESDDDCFYVNGLALGVYQVGPRGSALASQ